jgi:hypothetical protein
VIKQWIAALNGATITALQHCCGVNDAPVNCYIDDHGNWTCPNCLTTYGAPTPIGVTERLSVAAIHPEDE